MAPPPAVSRSAGAERGARGGAGTEEALYLALYRRFRPETFDKVFGQEHIVKILTNQLRDGTVGHAYLFCGTRGTGKTTMARLLAKGVNCLSAGERPCGACANCVAIRDGIFVDVIEIDAASNNGVENIRELRESVKYPPSVGARKVYIVDEVHMLSPGAFNALLKTLEEPPENVMFVLATTERHKLPATILSRCLRLDFKRVPAETIKNGMRGICAELGVCVTEEALSLLASNADGSVRDALSLLDQCVSGEANEVTRDTVLELLGSPGEEALIALTDAVAGGDVADALLRLDRLLSEGMDERQMMKDWIEHFRNLMLLRHLKRPEDVMNLSVESIAKLKEQSERLSPSFVNDGIFALAAALNDASRSTQPRVLLEVGIVRMASENAPDEARPAVAPPAKPSARTASAPPPGEARAPESKPPAARVKETLPPMTSAPRASELPPDEARPAVAPPAKPSARTASAPPADEARAPESKPAAPADEASAPPDEASAPPARDASPAAVIPALDWRAVVAEALKKSPMLARLPDRSKLAETGENAFVIEVFDEITKRAAEDGREPLEAAAARVAGRPLRMVCREVKSVRTAPKSASAPPEPPEQETVQLSFDS
ncbi:MAG: DNA polymerase III subunit gamma/tau [Clostridiales Family XIII bacterium]|nr:DNA polymerase III subunit gamma/tau [Clostridiales Family XIII bacterium]